MSTQIAVIGLGAMGLPIALRLAEQFSVTGFDIDPDRRTLLAKTPVIAATSAADAVAAADCVLLAVRTPAQLHALLFGSDGIAHDIQAGATIILTSTVGTQGFEPTLDLLAQRNIDLVDAPLSGGPVRARQGDLLIVVGAEPAALAKVQPILLQLGSNVSVVGPMPGAGQALKTVNQLLCGVHIAAMAEALALADALGLDRETTLQALTQGAGNSFMLGDRGPRALQAYTPEGAETLSRLDIFVKDMGIVGDATRSAHLATPVAAAAEQLFLLGQAAGLSAEDDSAVIKVIAPTRTETE